MAKVVAQNRRARYDYDIVDTVEAGIVLSGQEAKSCRMGNVNLSGAYVLFIKNKPILRSATIALYRFSSNASDYNPSRDRELLMSKREVERMQSALNEKGVSVIPIEVRADKYIKVLIGLGKGQKRIDKRKNIKEKDIVRRIKKGEEY